VAQWSQPEVIVSQLVHIPWQPECEYPMQQNLCLERSAILSTSVTVLGPVADKVLSAKNQKIGCAVVVVPFIANPFLVKTKVLFLLYLCLAAFGVSQLTGIVQYCPLTQATCLIHWKLLVDSLLLF
jgi:hypothetical protein